MGMNPRQFTREQLAAAGVERAGSRVRARLKPSLAGYFWLWLDGVPPTTTHHDKRITYVANGRGGRHATLSDSPNLVAAREWYLARVPERATLVPLRPPVCLAVVFRWPLPLDAGKWPGGAGYGHQHAEKPDLDNLLKTVKDVLALRGFVVDDAHVARDGGSEKRWCEPNQRPGVLVMARSLDGKFDGGTLFQPDAGDPPGVVLPLPWQAEKDLRAVGRTYAGRPLFSPFYVPPAAATVPLDLVDVPPDPRILPAAAAHSNGTGRNGAATGVRASKPTPRSNRRGAARKGAR